MYYENINNTMNYSELKNYIDEGLSTYQIAEATNKGQTAVRHWLEKYNLKTKMSISDGKCQICGKELTGLQRKFCSTKCKSRDTNSRHQTYQCQQKRGLERKKKLVEAKGGCCEVCGYNKNYAALEFHHVDPSAKEFNLDMRKLSNSTWGRILKEVEKCQLICSNCHAETHHPGLSIKKDEKS
jgi:hypothetical protein